MKVDGTIDKFKARLVIQAFKQKEGIDYFDTYAPIARITTIRLLLALASIHNLVIHQMDVKTIFLNGDLEEEVYMKQPEGLLCQKQTCITGSTMEYEFVALTAVGKEAEWLRNLIHEILIWPKLIASISIHCDSAATLAKAYMVYVLTTPMPELLEDDTVEAIRRKAKWENDDYICRGHILNEDASSKKFLGKDDLSLVQLGSHLRIEGSLRAHESDKGKGKEVAGPSVNMTEEVVTRKTQMLVVQERGLRTNPKTKVDAIAWWIDFGATTHVCKDRCWFQTYEPVEDGSVLYMGDDYFAPVHGKGSVVLEFSSRKSITLFNVLYVLKLHMNLISGPVLNKCGYKHVYEFDKYTLLKSGVFVGFGYYNNGMFMSNLDKVLDDSGSVYMSSSTVVNSLLWHARIIHETTAPYTPQQNGVAERKNKALKEMVNSMLSYLGLSEGFWGEAMLTACYLMIRVPDKGNKTTSYELCIEEDPRTYNEAMKSCDAALWKEAINDEIGSIMENNTWVLSDLPPSCKPLGCK
ncbi:zinc finger, CCHC-type containing protein [Tanacetum coccineum]